MSSDASKPPKQASDTHLEEAPDPDEDDLSDLDDVLDEFAATRLDSKPAPSSSGPGRPSTTTAAAPSSTSGTTTAGILPDDDEFARQLQAGMADLLGELESSPDMQRQFEQLVKELGEAAEAAAPSQPASQQKPNAAKDKES